MDGRAIVIPLLIGFPALSPLEVGVAVRGPILEMRPPATPSFQIFLIFRPSGL